MKILVIIQKSHPYSFGDKCVLSPVIDFCLNNITVPGPEVMSFEQFLVQCMCMVKTVLECKEYMPNLNGRVMGEYVATFEEMRGNMSSAIARVLTSIFSSDRVILLCNVLIRRYGIHQSLVLIFVGGISISCV